VPRIRPRSLCAQAINCVYSWDITYLPSSIKGQYYYLYAFVDLFSRKIVGWQVFDCESTEHACDLLESICRRQNIEAGQLTVHSDNGGPMKGKTLLALMDSLGVSYTRSRPSVSNDNPYSEALFKTLKYRADLPIVPFAESAGVGQHETGRTSIRGELSINQFLIQPEDFLSNCDRSFDNYRFRL
jgi:putative transposase